MTDRYTFLRLSPGVYSAGHHDDSGTWLVMSTHESETSREAALAARELNGASK